MGDVFELKEKLTQAMVTLNNQLFDELLLPATRPVPLPSIIDRHGYTRKEIVSGTRISDVLGQ